MRRHRIPTGCSRAVAGRARAGLRRDRGSAASTADRHECHQYPVTCDQFAPRSCSRSHFVCSHAPRGHSFVCRYHSYARAHFRLRLSVVTSRSLRNLHIRCRLGVARAARAPTAPPLPPIFTRAAPPRSPRGCPSTRPPRRAVGRSDPNVQSARAPPAGGPQPRPRALRQRRAPGSGAPWRGL